MVISVEAQSNIAFKKTYCSVKSAKYSSEASMGNSDPFFASISSRTLDGRNFALFLGKALSSNDTDG